MNSMIDKCQSIVESLAYPWVSVAWPCVAVALLAFDVPTLNVVGIAGLLAWAVAFSFVTVVGTKEAYP